MLSSKDPRSYDQINYHDPNHPFWVDADGLEIWIDLDGNKRKSNPCIHLPNGEFYLWDCQIITVLWNSHIESDKITKLSLTLNFWSGDHPFQIWTTMIPSYKDLLTVYGN